MDSEVERKLKQLDDLERKYQKGREAIEKARAEGKDVSEWEKKLNELEDEQDHLLEEIFDEGIQNNYLYCWDNTL